MKTLYFDTIAQMVRVENQLKTGRFTLVKFVAFGKVYRRGDITIKLLY